jgi:hypothetical protein
MQCKVCTKGFITTTNEFMTTKTVPTNNELFLEQKKLKQLTHDEMNDKSEKVRKESGSKKIKLLQSIEVRTDNLNKTPDFEQHKFCSNIMCDYNERLYRIIPL